MYWLEYDTFHTDPVWAMLAGGVPAREDALQAAFCRIQSSAAQMRSDGFLTAPQALRECRGRRQLLDLLASRVLEDRAPLLHQQGDECECLEGPWRDGYAYRVHKFLKKNPSKAENTRQKAQKADLRDARLKQQVYDRDGGSCRYCRSGPLAKRGMGRALDRRKVLTYDHVDPDRPAGADGANLVVACARCNEAKGHRTPAEADLLLLPEPVDAEKRQWQDRGLALFDRPESAHEQATDKQQTNDEQPDGRLLDELSVGRHSDDVDDHPEDVPAGEVRPDDDATTAETGSTTHGEGVGSGRVGHRGRPVVDQLGQPARGSDAPDIYHRRSRDPTQPRMRDPPPLEDHLGDL